VFEFDSKDNIYRFSVVTQPREASTRQTGYETKTPLRLPFEGEWYVASGGRTINYNHHVVARDQRFACDFTIRKGLAMQKPSQDEKSRIEHYHCFGDEILAPAPGIIIQIENSVKDVPPYQPGKGPGNYVIIDHGNNEYSFLAHFKKKSVVVKPGDRVDSGQLLGLCGNSGHSSIPHLHYHLQNTPHWGEGEGLPAQFQSYLADGVLVQKGEPLWHQQVRNK
jgi:hypothetical protein